MEWEGGENARHDPLESTWLSARTPLEALEAIITPEMEDEEYEELSAMISVGCRC